MIKERKAYLYKNIRQYCKEETKDILCPVFNTTDGDEDSKETSVSVEGPHEPNQPGPPGIQKVTRPTQKRKRSI